LIPHYHRDITRLDALSVRDRYHVLMGKRIDDPEAGDKIDSLVKTFLRKWWSNRLGLARAI
jgi:hypothetical protein